MAYTADDVLAIEDAIKSGALQVTYADRTVRYQSLEDLFKLRKLMQAEIDAALTPNKPRRRFFRVTQTGTGL